MLICSEIEKAAVNAGGAGRDDVLGRQRCTQGQEEEKWHVRRVAVSDVPWTVRRGRAADDRMRRLQSVVPLVRCSFDYCITTSSLPYSLRQMMIGVQEVRWIDSAAA